MFFLMKNNGLFNKLQRARAVEKCARKSVGLSAKDGWVSAEASNSDSNFVTLSETKDLLETPTLIIGALEALSSSKRCFTGSGLRNLGGY